MPPPRPGPTDWAGSRSCRDGRSVRPSPPAYAPPPSGRSCPRRSAPRAPWCRRRAAWVSPPLSPEAGSSCPNSSDSRSDTDCSSDPSRTPRASPHPLPVHPDWLSLADRPPRPPTWRSRTAFLTTSARPSSSSRTLVWLTERTNATDDPAPSLHPHRAQQELHRYYEPVRQRTPDRYSIPRGVSPLGTLPLAPDQGAVPGHAFSRSMREQQTRLTSPTCRTPPGQSAGTRRADPGTTHKRPGFDVTSISVTTPQQRSQPRDCAPSS
jgi:hypothetical protein